MALNFYIEPRPPAVQKVGNVPDMPLPLGPPKEHPTGGGGGGGGCTFEKKRSVELRVYSKILF